jgi:hypothetical protein
MTKPSVRRLLAAALLALGAATAPAASAASITDLLTPVALATGDNAPCTGRVLSTPFAQWNDSNSYFLAPGGSFEGGAPGWSFTGGASVKPGGEPFIDGSAGSSLALPAGSTASSPWICTDLASPTLRFFATGRTGTVTVSVLTGKLALPVATIYPGSSWQPTPAFVFFTNALSVLSPTGTTAVAFRFGSVGGDTKIDDVYVDPYRRK